MHLMDVDEVWLEARGSLVGKGFLACPERVEANLPQHFRLLLSTTSIRTS
jgi:hypothetical protein